MCIQLLLEHDGDVNSVDASGNSPLHCMCSEDRNIAALPDCVTLLVSIPANIPTHNRIIAGLHEQ